MLLYLCVWLYVYSATMLSRHEQDAFYTWRWRALLHIAALCLQSVWDPFLISTHTVGGTKNLGEGRFLYQAFLCSQKCEQYSG